MEILACAILLAGALTADAVAPSVHLQDARTGTPEEEQSYAAREAETPDLAEFRGGDGGGADPDRAVERKRHLPPPVRPAAPPESGENR